MQTEDRVFLALDNVGLDRALKLVEKLPGRVNCKINDLWDSAKADCVRALRDAGAHFIWVDAKLHDIPNTVANRVRAISQANVNYITVMADGEVEMMMAAVNARVEFFKETGWRGNTFANALETTGIIAVTALTSLSEEQVHLGSGMPVKAKVLYLARIAKLAGVQTLVCSPQEAGLLKKRPELAGMNVWTPGIRPAGKKQDDQKRVDTPTAAIKAGADCIVVGRAVTEAADPVAAFDAIIAEIDAALAA